MAGGGAVHYVHPVTEMQDVASHALASKTSSSRKTNRLNKWREERGAAHNVHPLTGMQDVAPHALAFNDKFDSLQAAARQH